MKIRGGSVALCSALAAVVLAACGSGGSTGAAAANYPAGSKMAAIAKSGKVRIGVQTTYPLVGAQTLDGYDGLDIRIAEALAGKLGLSKDQIQFVPVTTPTREAFLQQDKVDFIVAAYTITQERTKVIDFAGPYLESPSILMVRAGNPLGIQSLQDMSGKKLCAAEGSAQEAYIKQQEPEVAPGLTLFDSSAKCRDAVLDGQVDASTTESAIQASFVSQNRDKLAIVNKPYLDSFYGIGVKQEPDKTFCEWINTSLKELEADGTWAKAYEGTLGTVLGTAPQPPAVGSCTMPLQQ